MSTQYPPTDVWRLPRALLEETFAALRHDGGRGLESIVFWAGSQRAGAATITLGVALDGPGITKRPDFLRVSEDVMAQVAELLDPPSVVLLGQAHTHFRGTDHSPTDDRFIIDTPDYLSVVIEDFALDARPLPVTWGVHVGTGHGFRRLGSDEVLTRVLVQEGVEGRVVRIGPT